MVSYSWFYIEGRHHVCRVTDKHDVYDLCTINMQIPVGLWSLASKPMVLRAKSAQVPPRFRPLRVESS